MDNDYPSNYTDEIFTIVGNKYTKLSFFPDYLNLI